MMDANTIGQEFTAALKAASPLAESAHSTEQLAAASGWSQHSVRGALRVMIATGEWEVVRVRKKTLSGRDQTVLAYRPIQKQSKRKRK